jgi:capsular polysaccharide biosynthesis protein
MPSTHGLHRRALQALKRRLVTRLGIVSDQKFYLDSGIVTPRQDVERLTLHSGAVTLDFILPVDGSKTRNAYRPRYVYGLSEAIVDPIPNLVYDSRGQYIAESSSWLQLRQFWDWPKPWMSPPWRRLAGEYILFPTNNYYHWLIEDLPVFLKSLSVAPQARVLVPKKAASYVREVAQLIENEVVTIASPVRVERLVMTGKTGGIGSPIAGLTPHPADVAILRDFFSKFFESGPSERKLYLSRVGQSRSPSNERDLQARMEKLGFQVFDGVGMSLRSQIALFSRAKRLIGLHGAALSNIVWAPEGVDLCEIFSSGYMPSCYSALTAIRRGCYRLLLCGADSENRIDRETLEQLVTIASSDRKADELSVNETGANRISRCTL